MTPKTAFLVNPASANGKTGKRWPQLAQAAHAAGLEGEAIFSERPGQLGDLAREAVDDGAELLVVFGGDGTMHEVVNGIAGREGVEVAVVPRGTGWDFARTHKIPKRLDEALRIARDGEARSFDLGRASYRTSSGEKTAWFANAGSVGMSGAVAARANRTTKSLGAKTSYLLALGAVFARWSNVHLDVKVDGEQRSGPMEDVIVAIGRYQAGGMMVTPDAEPDDGLFDVLLIEDITKPEVLRALPKIYRGKHLPHPKAEVLRGRVVEVDGREPLPVQLDGEQPGTTPARFEIVPGAIRLRVPG
ncbi:MAG: diacylglycerol kinase family lipid kinase [Actinomycetota bacterium]|nr:diacylglycerol kinase family lipid kinase [Actinomycetota bacterium]